jgi:hypothetical protein
MPHAERILEAAVFDTSPPGAEISSSEHTEADPGEHGKL